MRGHFGTRLLLATVAALMVVIVWELMPVLRSEILSWRAEPRVVAPRGELAADEETIIAIFETARDSVVSISTAERVVDPWTRNVYNVPHGSGSGFLWDEAGHVVTNSHVVQGASQALVRLADGRTFRGELVGTDPDHDLAVLRIGTGVRQPSPLPLGTSGGLQVGQKVLAIGNPFGLDWTLTTGIVSALDREIPNNRGGRIGELIQTDAAINPGNSGGPLLDSAGRLIGVNTAIYSPSGSSAGIGFAIPVDIVNSVVPQLIAQGRYAPPSLGISTDPRTDDLLRRAGLKGVIVLRVQRGSAAQRAGLRPATMSRDGDIDFGDVIVGLGGEEIEDVVDLRAVLDRHEIGDEVVLEVLRDRKRVQIPITLEPSVSP